MTIVVIGRLRVKVKDGQATCMCIVIFTIFTLRIGTPYLLTILVLNFETVHSTTS